MERLPEFLAAKRRIAKRYQKAFEGIPGLLPMPEASWAESVYWMYTVLVDEREFGLGSRELIGALAVRGIQARPLWQPIHCSPAHAGAQTLGGGVAERLNRMAVSLPCSAGLDEKAQDRVIGFVLNAPRWRGARPHMPPEAKGHSSRVRETT